MVQRIREHAILAIWGFSSLLKIMRPIASPPEVQTMLPFMHAKRKIQSDKSCDAVAGDWRRDNKICVPLRHLPGTQTGILPISFQSDPFGQTQAV